MRFSIRALLLLTLACASFCGWLTWKRQQFQRRQQAIAHLEELSGPVSWYNEGSEFVYLHRIELQNHSIDDTLWNEISLLTEARTVSLSDTNVTDDDLKYLRRFWNIRDLYLSNTRVTSAGIESVCRLKTLRTLIISNTTIDDRVISSLSQLASLETLNVRGTDISVAGIEQLRLALPKCRLFHDGQFDNSSNVYD